MDRQLTEIGTIPVTTSIIESLYPELKSANKKVTWLEKQGFIIRLKRGLYVANPKHSGKTLSSELIANHLFQCLLHYDIMDLSPRLYMFINQ